MFRSFFLSLHFGNLAGFIAKIVRKKHLRNNWSCVAFKRLLRGLSPASSTQLSNSLQREVMCTRGGNQRQSCYFTLSTWCACLVYFVCFVCLYSLLGWAGEDTNTFIILLDKLHIFYEEKDAAEHQNIGSFYYILYQGSVRGARRETRPSRGRHNETPLMASLLMNVLAFTCMRAAWMISWSSKPW